MVSIRSATWTVVLVELVLSCAMLVASLAVASAQAQSVDMHNNKLSPTLPVIITCLLSFCLMTSAIFAMFGLSSHKPEFLLSHIFFSVVVSIFHAILTANWLVEWVQKGVIDGDWLISLAGAILFQSCLLTAVYLEIRCYRIS